MKDRIKLFLTNYLLLVAIFLLQKPIFMGYYHHFYRGDGIGAWLAVMGHGLQLDLAVAGYFTLLPGLLLLSSVIVRREIVARILKIYYIVVSIFLALVFIGDLVLYGFWGFRLDTTPLFYLRNPGDAMASVSGWFVVLGLLCVALCGWFYYKLFSLLIVRPLRRARPPRRRRVAVMVLLLLTAALILPIRGGLTVSTMNVGKVYFSDKTELNHAAINPVFSLLDSFAKQSNFGRQYRFMDPAEADRLFAQMVESHTAQSPLPDVSADTETPADTTMIPRLFRIDRPNIVLIIMESFMSSVTGVLGGNPDATPGLDSLSREGVLFTNLYGNSFRTDRGLVAILSGFPAQPTTSVMKYPKKSQSLPSLPRSLREAGYNTAYYYGGDADFTNMRSYLLSQGIERLVSDQDFPMSARLSKWGVPDHLLTERAGREIAQSQPEPWLRIVQTSSSHEPFDVPTQHFEEPYPNSVYYADSCIFALVEELRRSPQWERTAVILVADHAGRYPDSLGYFQEERFRIPMLIVGGAVNGPMRVDTYASQIDLAATLLDQLGLPYDEYRFSKNILDPSVPHFGYFTFPDGFGMATPENVLIYDNGSGRIMLDKGAQPGQNLEPAKAYLQKLYDALEAL